MPYAPKTTNKVRLDVTPQGLELVTMDIDMAQETRVNTFQAAGEPFKIAFNGKYLDKCLKTFGKKDTVNIYVTTWNRGAVIDNDQDPTNGRILLMPMVLENEELEEQC